MSRHFPHWLKAYLDYTKASEAPDAFHFWTGVSVIAGALRRRVWQEQHLFQWIPNFYIVFVAPAGVATKSTTLNLGMGLLEQVPDVIFGPESGSWQGLGDALAASTQYFLWPGNPDGSTEPIPMSAITVAASELGTFLRPDDEHAMSFLTDAWDGRKRKFNHRTKHSGTIEIQRPCLNIIGATTPSWLQRNMPENLIADGLLSRVVFVYAEKKRHYVSLPSRNVQGAAFRDVGKKLVEDLKEISNLVGDYEFCSKIADPGGWMDTWYSAHYGATPAHMASARYGGYLSRKQTHMVKLAMVLAASKRDTLRIELEDIIEADAILTDAEHAMIKVFESVGIVDEAKHVAEIAQFVRAHGWLNSRDLYRLCHNIMAERDFKQALRLAIEGDLLEVETRSGVKGVRPKVGTMH
jgi:hypothetical protein